LRLLTDSGLGGAQIVCYERDALAVSLAGLVEMAGRNVPIPAEAGTHSLGWG